MADMPMIALARLVVVTHETDSTPAAIKPILQTMRPVTRLARQLPQHHLNNGVALSITIIEKLPCPHMVYETIIHGGRQLAAKRLAPWYRALYVRRTDKTKQRDLRRLREQRLLRQDKQGRLWPGFVAVEDLD